RINAALNGRGTRVTRVNIDLCMPELPEAERDRLVRASLEHTGQMLMETPAAWLGDRKRILGWIRNIENEPLIRAPLAEGRGVIVILPHLGNWEMINVYLAERLGRVTGLYAPPRQNYLKPLMRKVRGRFGNELVPTTVKGIGTLFRRLKEGRLVVVLPDQVPATGKFAPFFGHDALTDILITRMLAKSDARVVCCVIKRLPAAQGFDVLLREAHPDIYANDPSVALAGMNRSVEACVQEAPEQYQWEYKRFKERPAGQLRLYSDKSASSEYH
ncbi:MAG: lysophospholipid acyltransferase family protein, partial [Pseudomonadales bacterium]